MTQFDATVGPCSREKRLHRRHLLFPIILLVHLLLLGGLALLAPVSLEARPPSAAVSVFDVHSPSAEPIPPTPVPRPPETESLLIPEPLIKVGIEAEVLAAAPIFDTAAAVAAGFGTTCDVASTLVRAFENDEFARAQLHRIGPTSRSVASAIMFWDGSWVKVPGDVPPDALKAVRQAIMEAARAAPPACQVEDMTGPRFVSVQDGERTTTLVIGSGQWRWEQLIASSPALDPTTVPATVDPATSPADLIGGKP